MRAMRTHWELFLWEHWWTTWRYSQAGDHSTSVLQVILLACVYSRRVDGVELKISCKPSCLFVWCKCFVINSLNRSSLTCFFFPGTSGVLLRKVNGTAIVQLPSKRQVQVRSSTLRFVTKKPPHHFPFFNCCHIDSFTQVLETCMVTVGRVSNVDHNKRIIGKAGRNRWLGIRPSSGLWKRKGGWAGRKIKPLPPMKSYVNLPSISAK